MSSRPDVPAVTNPEPTTWEQDPDTGAWRTPVGDGSIELKLYDDELDDWPPYAAARHTANLAARLIDTLDTDGTLLANSTVDQVLEAMIAAGTPQLADVVQLHPPAPEPSA
jgi:hypothetical protein